MVPRKVGSTWEIFAPAKLNLYLDVLGTRPDGFHELETLMVPVQVYDEVRWTNDFKARPNFGPKLRIRNLLAGQSCQHLGQTSDIGRDGWCKTSGNFRAYQANSDSSGNGRRQ